MNLFDNWRERELQSTMQRLQEENARLRRARRIDAIVYWTCLIGGTVLALMKLYGGCTP